MITEEKPALDENLLIHFGIKGMKWGVKKNGQPRLLPGARTSMNVGHKIGKKIHDARVSRADKPKMSTAKKVAIGAAVVGGAAAATFVLTKTGRTTIGSLATRFRASKPTTTLIPKKTSITPVSHIPSPSQLMSEASQAATRNRGVAPINRALTEKSWRDAALMKRATRETSRIPSVGEISRNLQDPNYVWHL